MEALGKECDNHSWALLEHTTPSFVYFFFDSITKLENQKIFYLKFSSAQQNFSWSHSRQTIEKWAETWILVWVSLLTTFVNKAIHLTSVTLRSLNCNRDNIYALCPRAVLRTSAHIVTDSDYKYLSENPMKVISTLSPENAYSLKIKSTIPEGLRTPEARACYSTCIPRAYHRGSGIH